MRYGSAILMNHSSVTAAATSFSLGVDTQQDWAYAVQAIYSGSMLGTLKLQLSLDNVVVAVNSSNTASNVVNWTDYTGSLSSTSGASGTSSFVWNVNNPGYRWMRVAYVNGSGTGDLTIQYFNKGV